jgi:hypothetical protein
VTPYTGQFIRNPLGSSRSTFGIPIAKDSVTDRNAAGTFTENMAQDIQTPVIPKHPWSLQNAHFAWGSVLIGVLMAAVYYRVLAKLVIDWWQIPDFSHGFLVPIFAAYLVWTKRTALLETKIAPHLERNCAGLPGPGGSAPGGLRSRTVPF